MELANDMLHAIFLRVLLTSCQASLLAVLILLIHHFTKGQISATMRHALWGVLLVRMLLPWDMPVPFNVYHLAQHVLSPENSSEMQGFLDFAGRAVARHPFDPTGAVFPNSTLQNVCLVAMEIWLVGVLVGAVSLLVQLIRLNRHLREQQVVTEPSILSLLAECRRDLGIRRAIQVVTAPTIAEPALLGFLKPCLLVPQDMLKHGSREELRFVFLHEVGHIKRLDILTGWLTYVAVCVHWFNPLLWWAKKRCMADRELACDELVLSGLGDRDRCGYGHALLDRLHVHRSMAWNPGLAGIFEGGSNIERRISMIAGFELSGKKSVLMAVAALVLVSIVALTFTFTKTEGNNPAGRKSAKNMNRPGKVGFLDTKRVFKANTPWAAAVHGKYEEITAFRDEMQRKLDAYGEDTEARKIEARKVQLELDNKTQALNTPIFRQVAQTADEIGAQSDCVYTTSTKQRELREGQYYVDITDQVIEALGSLSPPQTP